MNYDFGRVAIWGCGSNLNSKKDFVTLLNPVVFIDIAYELNGLEILPGVVCVSPEQLKDYQIDTVIITPENKSVQKQIEKKVEGKYKSYCLNALWEEREIELANKTDFGIANQPIKHFACALGKSACNIHCDYCYIDYRDKEDDINTSFSHSISYMIKALSQARLGGPAFFDMCSDGETLLKNGIVELVHGLLKEGHYVCLITNGTVTSKLNEILNISMLYRKRLLFHFSLHYLELKKKSLINTYFDNVNLVKESGASISMSLVGCDEYIPYIDEIKKTAMEKVGAMPYITAVRAADSYKYDQFVIEGKAKTWEEYIDLWKGFPGKSLELRGNTLGKICKKCYAGISSGFINLDSGHLVSCVPGEYLDNIYDDIKRKIKFLKDSHECKWGYCSHNAFFMSGREMNGKILPTWYEAYACCEKFISDEMRKAIDYCCNY